MGKNELTSKPTILDEIDRRIIQMEMERLSLQSDFESGEDGQEANKDAGKRLGVIDKELADLKNQQQTLNLKWMAEKGGVDRIKDIKTEIASVMLEIEKCEREFDLNQAAELKYAKLPPLQEELESLEQVAEEKGVGDDEDRMLRDEVIADDIADVVAVWTGIPPTKLLESERTRILSMGDKLKDRVIGQDEAVNVVTEAVQRSRAGLNDPTKPIASMIFLGPTGVGKTELCKALSEFMFDSEDAIIRIDMSEYGEKHTVSRLLGAPPGYVGYDEGGQLMDDGRLTDSKGNNVNFRNTLIVFTSNVGSQDILELDGDGSSTEKEMLKERVSDAMKARFKPEFLNRIDEHVIFNRLDKPALRKIVKLEINRLQNH